MGVGESAHSSAHTVMDHVHIQHSLRRHVTHMLKRPIHKKQAEVFRAPRGYTPNWAAPLPLYTCIIAGSKSPSSAAARTN